jgi:hypothetical protein
MPENVAFMFSYELAWRILQSALILLLGEGPLNERSIRAAHLLGHLSAINFPPSFMQRLERPLQWLSPPPANEEFLLYAVEEILFLFRDLTWWVSTGNTGWEGPPELKRLKHEEHADDI